MLCLQPVINVASVFAATRNVEVVGAIGDVVVGDCRWSRRSLRCAVGRCRYALFCRRSRHHEPHSAKRTVPGAARAVLPIGLATMSVISVRQVSRAPPPPSSSNMTVRRESLIFRTPWWLYSMSPSLLNLFMNEFTRDLVVPIMSASVC